MKLLANLCEAKEKSKEKIMSSSTQRIKTDEFGVEQRTYHDRTFAEEQDSLTRNNNSLNVKNGHLGTIRLSTRKKSRFK